MRLFNVTVQRKSMRSGMKVKHFTQIILAIAVLLVFGEGATHSETSMGTTELVSIAYDGSLANNSSFEPSISANGRFVVFTSYASNLVEGDTNFNADIFVRDRLAGTIERVSVASDGSQVYGASQNPNISADGRIVTFWSEADNLVSEDNDGSGVDLFIHDRVTGLTTLVDPFGMGYCLDCFISRDGRYVTGLASDHPELGDADGYPDIYFSDLDTGEVEYISRFQIPYPYPTPDSNQPHQAPDPYPYPPPVYGGSIVSNEGRFVVFVKKGLSASAIMIRDRLAELAEELFDRMSCPGSYYDAYPNLISGGGRFVEFTNEQYGSHADYVHDRENCQTEALGVALDRTQRSICCVTASSNFRYLAFASAASDLVIGDENNFTDVFVLDRKTQRTVLASLAYDGTQGNCRSSWPSISANGRLIAFESCASNLVAGDNNGVQDIFIREWSDEIIYQLIKSYLPLIVKK